MGEIVENGTTFYRIFMPMALSPATGLMLIVPADKTLDAPFASKKHALASVLSGGAVWQSQQMN